MMAQAVEPEPGAGSVNFEVERFEPRGRDQLVLSGRWFGLRGRRFVRPTLTLGNGDSRQRALADLEHKPWAAEDGELWEAAFVVQRNGGYPATIELTVAPDITVALPKPGSDAREQRIKARPRRDDLLDNLRGARRDGRPVTGSGNGRDPRRDGRSATGWEEGLEAQREAPRVPDARLRARSRAAVAARVSGSGEDAAGSRLTEVLAARDQATRAYEHAVKARDQALRERDRMRKELDRMAKERDKALRDRERAIAKANKAADAAAARPRADHRPGVAATFVAGGRGMQSPWAVWTQRVLAVSVLLIAVLAFAITARLV
jgi:hypothetical protein